MVILLAAGRDSAPRALGTGSIVSGWLGRFYEMMPPGTFWLMHGIIVGAGTGLLLLLRGPLSRALDSTSRAPSAAPNAMGISA